MFLNYYLLNIKYILNLIIYTIDVKSVKHNNNNNYNKRDILDNRKEV